jgi:hypothetical protein
MDPLLRRIADYLLAHPNRADIDPVEIDADLLPHFFILHILPQNGKAPPRVHIRLLGTALDAAFGRNASGRDLADFLHGGRSAEVLDSFHRCAVEQKPIWMRQVVQLGNRPSRFVEGVALPVAPDQICGGLTFGEVAMKNSPANFECRTLAC